MPHREKSRRGILALAADITMTPSLVTRRNFLAGSAAGLLASEARLWGGPQKAIEFRRGGMTYRRLGQTDLFPSLLSFGSHTDPADREKAPNGTVLTAAGQARRDQIVAHAFDLGVNLIDVYSNEGQWEPAARSVRGRRDRILISLAHDVSAREIDHACKVFGGYADLYRFHTAEIDGQALEDWDVLRKAKEAGKIRAIGIATHIERTMLEALKQLEGIDYLFFPYNFIHARADYSEFLPEAQRRGVGLIGMKPLASGSIMKLDPRGRPGEHPEFEALQLWQTSNKPVLPAAVAELTKTLGRLPDETLCMAAMRFVYSKPFISTAITGMFEDRLLQDNYQALTRSAAMTREEHAALGAVRDVAQLLRAKWLPEDYRWLEEQWRG
jgi:aryl-alcohol dehydrogenase-like predicted oxidoreductase